MNKFRLLQNGEIICIFFIFGIILFNVLYQKSINAKIIWINFLYISTPFALLMLMGFYLRALGKAISFAQFLISTSIIFTHMNIMPISFYLMLPLSNDLIDASLSKIDLKLGFKWSSSIEAISNYPNLSKLLKAIYLSTMLQIMIIIFALSFQKKSKILYEMLLTGMLGSLIMLVFWTNWPSIGPSAFEEVPSTLVSQTKLTVTPDYGSNLLYLTKNGLEEIGKHKLLGTVAFPSFHIFLAFLVVWFSRTTILLLPLFIINVLMLPATYIHGGHYFVDLIGGGILFFISTLVIKLLKVAFPDTLFKDCYKFTSTM